MLRPEDDAVLDQLRAAGDPLVKPRNVRAYLYLKENTRDGAATLAALRRQAEARGWAVREAFAPGLILSRQTAVDPATLARIVAELVELSETFGVEFDGWECALVRPSRLSQLFKPG